VLTAAGAWAAAPQTTAFTYQGQLAQNGTPTNGTHNLSFALFDAVTGGTQIGSTIAQSDYPVANGVFTIDLDFGLGTFSGKQLYLAVTVDGNALLPRQPVNSVPVAQYAMSGPSASSTATAASATQFQNDHLYAGVSVNGENRTMVMIANPAFSPSGTSTVAGYTNAIDVYSLTSGLVASVTVAPGITVGTPQASDIRVLAKIDQAYIGFVQKMGGGAPFLMLQVDVLDNAGAVIESYCYANVYVSGLQPMPQAGVFEMTLVPVQINYRLPNPSPPAYAHAGYNFQTKTTTAANCIQ
jgi:hypothetical protein